MLRAIANSVAFLSVLFASAATAFADDSAKPSRTITVTGEGSVTASPDMATIETGVVTQAESAGDALAANTKAMEKIMEVLKEHHVASKDVQTSQFSVQPVYKSDRRGQTQPEIAGYRVQNQVRVRVRNLADLGKILDALIQAGSNQVSGISFGVDDTTGLMNQARSRAFSDARSRANVYAQAAGVEVGRVMSISEQSFRAPQPVRYDMMFERAAAAVPVATGELELSVNVHVVYEMQDGV